MPTKPAVLFLKQKHTWSEIMSNFMSSVDPLVVTRISVIQKISDGCNKAYLLIRKGNHTRWIQLPPTPEVAGFKNLMILLNKHPWVTPIWIWSMISLISVYWRRSMNGFNEYQMSCFPTNVSNRNLMIPASSMKCLPLTMGSILESGLGELLNSKLAGAR